MKIGDRVIVICHWHEEPYGSRGTVTAHNPKEGAVWLTMDSGHKTGLARELLRPLRILEQLAECAE